MNKKQKQLLRRRLRAGLTKPICNILDGTESGEYEYTTELSSIISSVTNPDLDGRKAMDFATKYRNQVRKYQSDNKRNWKDLIEKQLGIKISNKDLKTKYPIPPILDLKNDNGTLMEFPLIQPVTCYFNNPKKCPNVFGMTITNKKCKTRCGTASGLQCRYYNCCEPRGGGDIEYCDQCIRGSSSKLYLQSTEHFIFYFNLIEIIRQYSVENCILQRVKNDEAIREIFRINGKNINHLSPLIYNPLTQEVFTENELDIFFHKFTDYMENITNLHSRLGNACRWIAGSGRTLSQNLVTYGFYAGLGLSLCGFGAASIFFYQLAGTMQFVYMGLDAGIRYNRRGANLILWKTSALNLLGLLAWKGDSIPSDAILERIGHRVITEPIAVWGDRLYPVLISLLKEYTINGEEALKIFNPKVNKIIFTTQNRRKEKLGINILDDNNHETYRRVYAELQGKCLMTLDDVEMDVPRLMRGGNQYNKIINPETGRKVSIHTRKGQEILNKYFNS
jgi:hypothetical protein